MVAALASTGKRPGPTLTAVTRIPHPPRGRAGRSGRGATRGRSWLARAALLPAAALAFLAADALAAPAASADGTGPTNFESLVDSVQPAPPGVEVEVLGGDSFLQVRAPRGTEVDIPGYDGEPYLRIDAEGRVHRNARSSATYLNSSRDGTGVELPDDVSARAEPRWVRVGDGGEVAWHDHRIHWMVSQAPTVGNDRVVQTWSVPMVVDGSEVEVSGRLLLLDDEVPWAAGVAVAGLIGSLVLASRPRWRIPLLAGASLVALALGVAAGCSRPPPGPAAAPATPAEVLTPEQCTAQGGQVRGDIGDGQIACAAGERELGRVRIGVEGGVCCAPDAAP